MLHKTRLRQWLCTVTGFRGITIRQAAQELGMPTEVLSRRLSGTISVQRKDAVLMAKWGAEFGNPSAADIWAWSAEPPLNAGEFFEMFGQPQ
ncbi:MAG: helix-turn-helix domain-containing protein [Nannocystaceae bacterium]